MVLNTAKLWEIILFSLIFEHMGRRRAKGVGNEGLLMNSGIGFLWCPQDENYHIGGLFACVGQMGMGFEISPKSTDNALKLPISFGKHGLPEPGLSMGGMVSGEALKVGEEGVLTTKNKKKSGLNLKVKIGNPSLRRLISGGIAGAVSRTAVAPLETVRTHLMVGSCGHSTTEVFQNILKHEGWQGLFRGNLVNVIRVAPSKAIEV